MDDSKIKYIVKLPDGDKLLEILRTCQADLLILNDVLIDIMNCESENDIEFLLQAANENFGKD
jgi:hypothetical protein